MKNFSGIYVLPRMMAGCDDREELRRYWLNFLGSQMGFVNIKDLTLIFSGLYS
jgi:uncharacterized lipoprotein YehR (DUF1307 family)